jgi:hypothetical protein
MKRIMIIFLLFLSLLQAQAPERIRAKSIPAGVGLSLALPGAGQLYAGNKSMAIVYFTLEAAFIGGNIYFIHQGRQSVAEYEGYADIHWSVDKWIDHYNPLNDPTTHGAIIYVDNRAYYPHVVSSYDAMMDDIDDGYTSIIIEKDYHFYENIGKYEQFKAGWDDWAPGTEDPSYPKYSDKQYEYSSMRKDANILLKAGGYFGTAILMNHFISAFDAAFRIKKANDNQQISVKLYSAPLLSGGNKAGFQTGIYVTF